MKNLTFGAICLLSSVIASPASANDLIQLYTRSWCNSVQDVHNNSWERFKETPLFTGYATADIVLTDGTISQEFGAFTVYANQDTGTFAATMTFSDGVSCILTAGSNFEPYMGPRPERPQK